MDGLRLWPIVADAYCTGGVAINLHRDSADQQTATGNAEIACTIH